MVDLPELTGWMSIPVIVTWDYLWYGMQTWHKSKPKMVEFLEIPQGLHKLKKQGVMGMKLAHFSIQLVKVQWVAGSSYNVTADDQRCLKGMEIGKKVLTLWSARLGTVRQHVAFDTDDSEAPVLYQKADECRPWDIPFNFDILEERHIELSK